MGAAATIRLPAVCRAALPSSDRPQDYFVRGCREAAASAVRARQLATSHRTGSAAPAARGVMATAPSSAGAVPRALWDPRRCPGCSGGAAPYGAANIDPWLGAADCDAAARRLLPSAAPRGGIRNDSAVATATVGTAATSASAAAASAWEPECAAGSQCGAGCRSAAAQAPAFAATTAKPQQRHVGRCSGGLRLCWRRGPSTGGRGAASCRHHRSTWHRRCRARRSRGGDHHQQQSGSCRETRRAACLRTRRRAFAAATSGSTATSAGRSAHANTHAVSCRGRLGGARPCAPASDRAAAGSSTIHNVTCFP